MLFLFLNLSCFFFSKLCRSYNGYNESVVGVVLLVLCYSNLQVYVWYFWKKLCDTDKCIRAILYTDNTLTYFLFVLLFLCFLFISSYLLFFFLIMMFSKVLTTNTMLFKWNMTKTKSITWRLCLIKPPVGLLRGTAAR